MQAQYTPGEAYFGTNGYIEYYAGDLPIIISAPHGGYLIPDTIPDRNCSGCVTGRDGSTEEIAYLLRDAIKSVFGKDPHIIINKLARIKLDANREIVEAAQGNPMAETAWYEFHDFIQASKNTANTEFGSAIYIDLHSHGHSIQRIELGYLISRSTLQKTDSVLNAQNTQNSSSIKHLKNVINPSVSFSEILRGSECMGEVLVEHGYPSVPSHTDPAPAGNESYFNGGYNIRRHGSRDSSNINGIQFELNNSGIRNNNTNRNAFSRALACSLRSYLDKWYFDLDSWDPGNTVTSAADHGPGTLRSVLLGVTDGDVIVFDESLNGDTIRLESELTICADVTIKGPGADLLAISGGDSVRIFRTISHDSLNIENLSLVYGRTPDTEDGGALFAEGSVRLSNCILSHNHADDDGGAISIQVTNKVIRIDSCNIINNSCSDDGGALRVFNGNMIINATQVANNFSPSNGGAISSNGTIDIFNSTFSNNIATDNGGAIRSFGGIITSSNSTYSLNSVGNRGGAFSSTGVLIFDHCTIANNSSSSLGGGIRLIEGGTAIVKNSIVADNSASNHNDVSMNLGTFTSEGYNFISDTTGSKWIKQIGDTLGNSAIPIQVFFENLGNNGGLTETISFLPNSPAKDKANPSTLLIYDQRGENRIFCDTPDIGALELQLDTIVWTGAIDTDWLKAENWNTNTVPSICNIVEVPGIQIVAIQPIISFPNAQCKDIFLQSMSKLILLNEGSLKIREE